MLNYYIRRAVSEYLGRLFDNVANEISIVAPAPGHPTLERFVRVIRPAFEEAAKKYGYRIFMREADFTPTETATSETQNPHLWQAKLEIMLYPYQDGGKHHQIDISIHSFAERYAIDYKAQIGFRDIEHEFEKPCSLARDLGSPFSRQTLRDDPEIVLWELFDPQRTRALFLVKPPQNG